MKPLFTLLLLFSFCLLKATQWDIGPAQTYSLPSQVSGLVHDGDTVNIQARLYTGDVCLWTANNLLLRGVGGGFAHLDAGGQAYGNKAIWVINGNNDRIEYIEFSGCTISQALGNNGAGIRHQGHNLTISHCYFHDNQDGILTNADSTADILIEYTEFKHNGAGDGYSHNMYIGHIHSFTLRYCYTHQANVGHNVKTRAYLNYILYNRIMDEQTGNASYQVDIPNGGQAFIIGNIIHKGTQGQNPYSIRFGEEGYVDTTQSIYAGGRDSLRSIFIINNTMVNQLTQHSPGFIAVATGADTVVVLNNLHIGPGTFLTSTDTTLLANNLAGSTTDLVDTSTFNYRLRPTSSAIDAGVNPGITGAYSLIPAFEYLTVDSSQPRGICGNAIDIGAYEYLSVQRDTINTAICAGQDYNGHTIAGTYIDTTTAYGGCMTINTLNLTINALPDSPSISRGINDTLVSTPATRYQWFGNGGLLPGDTGQAFIPNGSLGICYVVITDSLGCTNRSADYILEGISQPVKQEEVMVYPNPAHETFTISIPMEKPGIVQVKVFDMEGRRVYTTLLTGQNSTTPLKVDAGRFLPGAYFIKVNCGSKEWPAKLLLMVE